jgi:hypothetical protein
MDELWKPHFSDERGGFFIKIVYVHWAVLFIFICLTRSPGDGSKKFNDKVLTGSVS